MICHVNDKRSFWVEDAGNIEDQFTKGTPILCTGSHRLCQQVSQFLFNEFGWAANIHCQKDDNCPYVLVLLPAKLGGKASAANVKTARMVAKAMAVGIESNYLYALDR